MRALRQTSLVSLWHHRVLGTLWAVGGMACLADLHRSYWWEQRKAWLPALVGLVYLVTGAAFLCCRSWARRAMLILMVLAGLLFADWTLAGLMLGNQSLLWLALGGFGCAVYTVVFVLRSPSNHSA
jgi:hypothetical protein